VRFEQVTLKFGKNERLLYDSQFNLAKRQIKQIHRRQGGNRPLTLTAEIRGLMEVLRKLCSHPQVRSVSRKV
jgi:hypothetical protein